MSIVPGAAEAGAFAVTPIVDYEPPPRDAGQCRMPSPTAVRRPNTSAPQYYSGRIPDYSGRIPDYSGRIPDYSGRIPAPAWTAAMRQAGACADSALRRVLEVIDRRRPAAQLHGMLATPLVDAVLAAHRGAGGRRGAAVLRRLRLQAVGAPEQCTAAEAFGTYTRGRRVHAIACRVEQVAPARWQVVALHIG
ncbi:Rv3235 family protein [Mycobacterium sp.]|uniref:Rv3235 family protein n=1 Tax=Mycobacterium sp. TaxID=1785 RepID=UPI0031E0F2D9